MVYAYCRDFIVVEVVVFSHGRVLDPDR